MCLFYHRSVDHLRPSRSGVETKCAPVGRIGEPHTFDDIDSTLKIYTFSNSRNLVT